MESILLTTSNGEQLDGEIVESTLPNRGAVVVCHPHPQHGGNRHNPVVDAVFRHLPTIGFTTLRFDFREEFGGGVPERDDVVSAIDEIGGRASGPVYLAGYSFGAAVALGTLDERIVGTVAVAPPLAMMTVDAPLVPVLLLVPQHDQFTPPDAAAALVESWTDCEMQTIESADHFLYGHTASVAERAGAWLTGRR